MDDEISVQNLLKKFLESCDYNVTTASDGMEAYSRFKAALETDNPIEVAVMDLVVNNGLGGIDSFRLIRKLNPEVIGIISSAYSDDSAMADYQRHGFRAVLSKPYQLLDLKRLIEELIDEEE